jgi:hypothetical protein
MREALSKYTGLLIIEKKRRNPVPKEIEAHDTARWY